MDAQASRRRKRVLIAIAACLAVWWAAVGYGAAWALRPVVVPASVASVMYCLPPAGIAGGFYPCRRDDVVIPL